MLTFLKEKEHINIKNMIFYIYIYIYIIGTILIGHSTIPTYIFNGYGTHPNFNSIIYLSLALDLLPVE